MIEFHEQHQSGPAQVSINHLFPLSEGACWFGRFREFNQIQPPHRIFECRYDSLEWPERCHAKALDLESFDGHFHAPPRGQSRFSYRAVYISAGTRHHSAGEDSTTSTSSAPRSL